MSQLGSNGKPHACALLPTPAADGLGCLSVVSRAAAKWRSSKSAIRCDETAPPSDTRQTRRRRRAHLRAGSPSARRLTRAFCPAAYPRASPRVLCSPAQVEIKVYKQKVKHLLYEHQNNVSQLKEEQERALKLQLEEHRVREAESKKDKRSLKLELKEVRVWPRFEL